MENFVNDQTAERPAKPAPRPTPQLADYPHRVAEFGRTSFKAAQAIFHDGVCAAAGRATLVCMDLKTRKATPLPDAAIERLSQWKIA